MYIRKDESITHWEQYKYFNISDIRFVYFGHTEDE